MNPEQFVKNLYRDIWQGEDISKISDYYADDIKAVLSASPEAEKIEDSVLVYSDIVKQAKWQKETFEDVHFDFKSIFSNAENTIISFYFFSSIKDRNTSKVYEYRVSGEYHLNSDGKINAAYAIMLPFHPFKH